VVYAERRDIDKLSVEFLNEWTPFVHLN
jgi:hypothetical protein